MLDSKERARINISSAGSGVGAIATGKPDLSHDKSVKQVLLRQTSIL